MEEPIHDRERTEDRWMISRRIGYETWKAQAQADLEGVPFEKKMITHTYEDIDIQPIYIRRDGPGERPSGLPGSPAIHQGNEAAGQFARRLGYPPGAVSNPEPAAANADMLGESETGRELDRTDASMRRPAADSTPTIPDPPG